MFISLALKDKVNVVFQQLLSLRVTLSSSDSWVFLLRSLSLSLSLCLSLCLSLSVSVSLSVCVSLSLWWSCESHSVLSICVCEKVTDAPPPGHTSLLYATQIHNYSDSSTETAIQQTHKCFHSALSLSLSLSHYISCPTFFLFKIIHKCFSLNPPLPPLSYQRRMTCWIIAVEARCKNTVYEDVNNISLLCTEYRYYH